jgi:hypothetical protein
VSKLWSLIVGLCGALGGLACFLTWLGIKPQDLRGGHMSLAVPHWFWLLFGLALFAFSIGLSAFTFFRQVPAPPPAEKPKEPSKPVIRRSVYDVVDDCLMGEDPPGPWKYGYSQGVGNGFNLFKARSSDAFVGVDRWFCPVRHEDMGVMHNRTDYTVGGEPSTYTIPAKMMHMHPGKDGHCAVIRWQCPEDGIYTIQGSCEGLDKQLNADPEVHIMKNLCALRKKSLHGVGDVWKFEITEPFESKDKLDFVVSQGVNWGSDSVGLKATIRKV